MPRNMSWDAAYNYLMAGSALTLPEWGGYWKWDEERKTILMHTKTGDVMDMRDSENMAFTTGFMTRSDWMTVSDVKNTQHHEALLKKEEVAQYNRDGGGEQA